MDFSKIMYEVYDSELINVLTTEKLIENLQNRYKDVSSFSSVDIMSINTTSDIQVPLGLLKKEFKCNVITPSKFLFEVDDGCFFSFVVEKLDYENWTLNFQIFAIHQEKLKRTSKIINDILEDITHEPDHKVTFSWNLFERGSIQEYELPAVLKDSVFPESYPYVENFDSYIDNFINGNENILILYGVPGTGKTRFIREIIKRMNIKYYPKRPSSDDTYGHRGRMIVTCTNSTEVINDDKFYFSYLCGSSRLMILEDADYNIMTNRKDGNDNLNKLLFTADGLIPTNKKIIISTNLTMKNIDDAIVRNGRCYDVLKTRELSRDEIETFINKYNEHYNKQILLSDIIHNDENTLSLCDVYKRANGEKQIEDKGEQV